MNTTQQPVAVEPARTIANRQVWGVLFFFFRFSSHQDFLSAERQVFALPKSVRYINKSGFQ